MRTAWVVGEVVATVKHAALADRALLLVAFDDENGTPTDEEVIAVDAVSAGVGDHVLVHDEGAGASQVLGTGRGPVRTTIVGIVDSRSREGGRGE